MLLRFGSLRTRIVVLTTVPLGLVLVTLLFVAHRTADRSVRQSVESSLVDAGSVLGALMEAQQRELMNMARVVADDPRFFVTFSIPEEERGEEFEPTVRGVLHDFLRITDADLLEVLDPAGSFHLLAENDADRITQPDIVAGRHGIEEALRGKPVHDVFRWGDQCVVAAVVPVYVAGELAAILRAGNLLDADFLADIRRLTGAEVALRDTRSGFGGTFPEAGPGEEWPTTPASSRPGLRGFHAGEAMVFQRGGQSFLGIEISLRGADPRQVFHAYLGRDLEAELAPARAMEVQMASLGLAALLLTVGAGYLAASTVTRPLSQVVGAAEDLARGDYATPLEPQGRDEVATLSRCFSQMRDSLHQHVQHLQDIDQMKSDFIALAGHELKTPLTVITSFNDLIASGDMGELPEDVRETSAIIKDQLSNLNRLVQDILDLSVLEQGIDPLDLAPQRPADLVRATVDAHREGSSGRDVEVRTVIDPAVLDIAAELDAHRVQQALSCLLDNAIRFTPDGGSVTVRASTLEGSLELAVVDNGIGIPAHELDWIFDKGYEVGDVMKHKSGRLEFGSKGFGLGLALCRAIVERHGGSIEVRSSLGKGSEFALRFPLGSPVREPVPA